MSPLPRCRLLVLKTRTHCTRHALARNILLEGWHLLFIIVVPLHAFSMHMQLFGVQPVDCSRAETNPSMMA